MCVQPVMVSLVDNNWRPTRKIPKKKDARVRGKKSAPREGRKRWTLMVVANASSSSSVPRTGAWGRGWGLGRRRPGMRARTFYLRWVGAGG